MKKGTILKLHEYFFTNHKDEVPRAMKQFFKDDFTGPGGKLNINDDREESLFLEWLTFDYKMQNDRKLMENFIIENPYHLSKQELQVYEDMQMNKYGLYEIKKIKIDEWLELESLSSGKIYKIVEKIGTHEAKTEQIFICRVGKIDGHFEMIGSDPIVLPVHFGDGMKKMFLKDEKGFTPINTREIFLKPSPSKSPTIMEKTITKGASMSNEAIEIKRKKISKKLANLLKETQSPHSLEEILAIIYNEKGQGDMAKIIHMFDDYPQSKLQGLLNLIAEAWNYFPHKQLDNKSPQQKAKELYGDKANN